MDFIPETSNRQHLYDIAKASLGEHLCGEQHLLGCALTVNAIFKSAFGSEIGGGASTIEMYSVLKNDNRFKPIDIPNYGDIIISPTGTGNGKIVGHVGIVGKYGIMSNDSKTGTLQEKYTQLTWNNYYKNYGGIPTKFFRVIG